jgi:hypothetical protein
MRRRVRSLLAALLAVIAISMTVTPALAVKQEQYNSTINFWNTVTGACRTYHGNAIHIQLTTTTNGPGGKYTISVYRCSGGSPTTLVGGAGTCTYPGFCGLGWSINLNGSQYAFKFQKTAGDWHDIIDSRSVQMWSTS